MVHGRQGRWSVRRRPFELLEDAHMEHVVKTGAGRKSEANCDLVDQLDDVVGAVVARSELSRRSLRKRRCCAMPKPEKGPVAHLVRDPPMASVVVAFLKSLRLFQPVPDVVEELRAFLHAVGDSRHPRLAWLVRPNGRRVSTIDDVE